MRIPNRTWFDALFTVVFPDNCRICERPLETFTRAPVCPDCLGAMKPLRARALCSACGIPLEAAGAERCAHCIDGEYKFDQARSYGAYDGALREVIHLLKYRGMRPLARPLARHMAAAAAQLGWDAARFQAMVAVPLAKPRLRERGFNQSELLAAGLHRLLRIPVVKDTCRRVRATALQTGLTRAQRFDNMRGAFETGANSAAVAGRDVLLIDDVLTTGATLSACARALREAGARSVCALTAARTLV